MIRKLRRFSTLTLVVACGLLGPDLPGARADRGAVLLSMDGRGPELDVSRLHNGLTVILHRDPAAPRVGVHLAYRAGSAHEARGRTGVAHLLEHLMFEGSEHVPPGAFDEWLREAGGESNAATGEDATHYWLEVPPEGLERALFLESDRMGYLAGAIDQAALEREKRVIAREADTVRDESPSLGDEWIARPLLFPGGHPYGHPVIGNAEDLEAVGIAEVLEFHSDRYGPPNACLVVAGPIEVEATRSLVEKWFAEIPAGKGSGIAGSALPAAAEEKRIVRESDFPESRLSVQWPSAPLFSRDHAALALLAGLLADGPGSHLRKVLVEERGLAVDVSARQEGLGLGGVFTVEVEVAPGRSHEGVLGELDRAITEFLAGGITRAAIRRSREVLATRFLGEIEAAGGFRGLAHRLGESWALTGDPTRFLEELAATRSLRRSDIRSAAARWLGPGRAVLSTVERGKRDLAVRPPEGRP